MSTRTGVIAWLMISQKVAITRRSSSRRTPGSSYFKYFWMPPAKTMPGQAYQARHDDPETFYEVVMFRCPIQK
jgi:hypothetical protein